MNFNVLMGEKKQKCVSEPMNEANEQIEHVVISEIECRKLSEWSQQSERCEGTN